MNTLTVAAIAAPTALALTTLALRRWVTVLDTRLLLDECIPNAADVAATEPAVVAHFTLTERDAA